jgi:hypothetical protein
MCLARFRFSVTRFPRIARLDNVHLEPRKVLAHCQARHVPTVAPLLVHRGARESRAPLSTRIRAPAGVPSLRMCRCPSELARAHSQGGHPRESRIGEACHSHQAGRRAARRWPQPTEDHKRLTPPQCGEPERRRDERRTRRQAGVGKISPGRVTKADYASSAHENGSRGNPADVVLSHDALRVLHRR